MFQAMFTGIIFVEKWRYVLPENTPYANSSSNKQLMAAALLHNGVR